jgi:hypothetical protein
MNSQQLVFQYEILQPDLQKKVLDFVNFLIKQQQQQQRQTIQKRTVGEYKDKIRIYSDFDAPLPDDFWMGEEK